MMLSKDQEFFYAHAGTSWNPATETREQGKKSGAIKYAAAEEKARNHGITFHWELDDTTSEEFSNEQPFYPLWRCGAMTFDGQVCGGLFSIDFGRDGDPSGSTYRRVVEAEIAMEISDEDYAASLAAQEGEE